MLTILATFFVFGILVFVHELGHFLAAKLFRIRVDRFSLGFPPRIVGKKIGDTDYCISWIPFGGYVKIAGMVDESLDKKQLREDPKPWEYRSRSWGQKVTVVLAGPFMNFCLAFVIFVALTLISGVGEFSNSSIVGSVVEGNPADKTGILPGDRIVRIDGKEITSWEMLAEIIHGSAGKSLKVEWIRNDSLFLAEMTPVTEKIVSRGEILEVGLIGIGPKVDIYRVGIGKAVVKGGMTVYYFTKLVFISIAKLITGEESIRSLAGPVFIAKMAGESVRSGLVTLIGFIAFLSLNLGLINLLPIPVIDGGHLLLLGIEGIIRKPIPLKVKLIVQQIGMVIILCLMIFVIYNDIVRVFYK